MNLPKDLLKFLVWWAVKAPGRLFELLKRAVLLSNNSLAFTLSIKLLFTPLFGDFTLIGRLMGFVFRTIKIVIGTIVLLSVLSFSLAVLPLWYLAPPLIFLRVGWVSFILYGMVFLLWEFTKIKHPEKRISELKSDENPLCCLNFNHETTQHFDTNRERFLQEFIKDIKVERLLLDLEFITNDFVNDFYEKAKNLTVNTKDVLAKCLEIAKKNKSRFIETEHIFLSLVSLIPSKETFLAKYSVSIDLVEKAVFWKVDERESQSKIFFWQEDYEVPPIGGVNRGMTSRVTPILTLISEDYTQMAERGFFDKVIGKKKAIGEVIGALSRSAGNNVLIIGEPGSGKTTLVKAIALEIVSGTLATSLKFKRLVALDSGALIAGLASPGQISERIGKIMKEASGAGNIIIFVDEIHNLVASTGSENSELSSVFGALLPYLEGKDIQFIGATSMPDYRKYVEPNGAFTRLFQTVHLDEATPEETLEILKVAAKKFQKVYKVAVSFLALERAVELSKKLIRDRVLPDKAIAVLEKSCVLVAGSNSTRYVTSEVISQVISQITKVPVTQITTQESAKLLNLEAEVERRVVGQKDAISQICDALRRARTGVRDENRPIASFLFVGTTGVGKTETAKALSQIYFGDEKVMIRIDMSEYQQDDSINKLIGTSDGKTVGILTDKIRRSPFVLILLDEIEKASSKVLLAFLQVLDDGRLTDSTGRVVDFTNSIIIATSNVGTTKIQEVEEKGGSYEEMKEKVMIEVRNKFAPEFLNRFSGIITFKPLDPADVKKIAELLLAKVVMELSAKGIKISFKPELVDKLARDGFDPQWGARPLRRLIENTVESYLAKKLLASEINPGDSLELGIESTSIEKQTPTV